MGRHRPKDVKRAIVAEYDSAPRGQRASVLDRHEVTSAMVSRWRASFGMVAPDMRTRKRYSEEEKARIVAEYDAAPHGEKAATLERLGVASGSILAWRRKVKLPRKHEPRADLRAARIKKGLTQKRLADAIGVSESAVWASESGYRGNGGGTADKISRFLRGEPSAEEWKARALKAEARLAELERILSEADLL